MSMHHYEDMRSERQLAEPLQEFSKDKHAALGPLDAPIFVLTVIEVRVDLPYWHWPACMEVRQPRLYRPLGVETEP